ncbi:MAG: VOC family protein [Succinivibrio sp.]|nr:VOC family protein [Succinivibrio sp.]
MKIEHLALYVNDLEGAREFCERYLQGKSNSMYHNPKTGFRSYFISFADGARLELMTRPDLVDEAKNQLRTGYAHLCLSVGSKERVDELTARFKEDGFAVVSGPRTTGDGYYESCVEIFEGNLLELTV